VQAHDEPVEPYKEFIREMTLRIEAAMRAFGREMREMRGEMREMRAENRVYFKSLQAHMDRQWEETRELREENRAQTQALLHILDRLDNGGAAPAT
jgi:hypothetical protein